MSIQYDKRKVGCLQRWEQCSGGERQPGSVPYRNLDPTLFVAASFRSMDPVPRAARWSLMGSLTIDPVRRMRSGRLRSRVPYCGHWDCWYRSDFAGQVLTPVPGVDSGAMGAD